MGSSKSDGWINVSGRLACPICAHTDWCSISEDGRAAMCWRILDGGRVKQSKIGQSFAIHRLDGVEIPEGLTRTDSDGPRRARSSPEEVSAVYEALQERLPLYSWHRELLTTKDGLAPKEVTRNEFASWPKTRAEADEITESLEEEFSRDTLLGTPGLFEDEYGGVKMLAMGGWCIPVKDMAGRYRGFRIRLDKPMSDGGRYIWASSNRRRGPKPDTCAACFQPEQVSTPGLVCVTEGEKKAIILSRFAGAPCVSVPGVGSALRAMEWINHLRPKRVAVAFDQDENPSAKQLVFQSLSKLRSEVKRLGYQFEIITWGDSND